MTKAKSGFLSGMGKVFEIMKAITNAVLDIGGDDSDLDRSILKDADLRKQIATPIVGVKSSVSCSFAKLKSACKQAWASDNFNEKNFPLEPVADDEAEWEVYEHHFDKMVNGMDAFKKLKKLGYRLCGPRRAMEYVANGHLDVQLDHPLIVTARWQASRGTWYAPIFSRDCVRRSLDLFNLVFVFDPCCGWLVLRKRP